MMPVWPFTLDSAKDTGVESFKLCEGCLFVCLAELLCEFFIEAFERSNYGVMVHG